MLAEAGPTVMEHPVMRSASTLHHVRDALDKLLKVRNEAITLIVKRIKGEDVTAALDTAIDETRNAGTDLLSLFYPGFLSHETFTDAERVIKKWTAFKELRII